MSRPTPHAGVSIALVYTADLPYERAAYDHMLSAALNQDVPVGEVLIVDGRGPSAELDLSRIECSTTDRPPVRHLPGTYANRAAMYNAARRAARGDFLLVLYNAAAPVTLRRSAVQTFVMSATRTAEPVGLVYADYERLAVGPDGRPQCTDAHLLDWHPGRLRDSVDFGAAII